MTWFRFTRKGPWHLRQANGKGYVARCWRDTPYPNDVRDGNPPAGEPRCKACMKRLEKSPGEAEARAMREET